MVIALRIVVQAANPLALVVAKMIVLAHVQVDVVEDVEAIVLSIVVQAAPIILDKFGVGYYILREPTGKFFCFEFPCLSRN